VTTLHSTRRNGRQSDGWGQQNGACDGAYRAKHSATIPYTSWLIPDSFGQFLVRVDWCCVLTSEHFSLFVGLFLHCYLHHRYHRDGYISLLSARTLSFVRLPRVGNVCATLHLMLLGWIPPSPPVLRRSSPCMVYFCALLVSCV
jgi:hypothetical protein